jgi:hypothetical protein
MIRLVHIPAGYAVVLKHAFYRVVEIVPYQKVEQGEAVTAWSQERFGRTPGKTFLYLCDQAFRENTIAVDTVFKIILPPGDKLAFIESGGGFCQQICQLFYIHKRLLLFAYIFLIIP